MVDNIAQRDNISHPMTYEQWLDNLGGVPSSPAFAESYRLYLDRCQHDPAYGVDNRDVLEKAQTALDNTVDYEKRHGRGINLTPVITELMTEVRRLRESGGAVGTTITEAIESSQGPSGELPD